MIPHWLDSYFNNAYNYQGNYFDSWGFAIPVILTAIFAVIFGLVTLIDYGDHTAPWNWNRNRWNKFIRRISLCTIALWAIPVVSLLVFPALILTAVFFVVRAWVDLIPSKQDRVAKAERKLADARGKVATARSVR